MQNINMIVFIMINKSNGKMYIGHTIQLLKKRINHFNAASKIPEKEKAPILDAIRKYGINNFEFHILWKGNVFIEMLEMQKFYIAKYNSMFVGYNRKTGGVKEKFSPIWIHPQTGKPIPKKVKEKIRITNKQRYQLHPEQFIAFKEQQGNSPNYHKGKKHPGNM